MSRHVHKISFFVLFFGLLCMLIRGNQVFAANAEVDISNIQTVREIQMAIQDALDREGFVVVKGSLEILNLEQSDADTIELNIENGKNILWEAKYQPEGLQHTALKLVGDGSMVMVEGKLETSSREPVIKLENQAILNAAGGLIQNLGGPAIYLSDDAGQLRISGAKIMASNPDNDETYTISVFKSGQVDIQRGVIFGISRDMISESVAVVQIRGARVVPGDRNYRIQEDGGEFTLPADKAKIFSFAPALDNVYASGSPENLEQYPFPAKQPTWYMENGESYIKYDGGKLQLPRSMQVEVKDVFRAVVEDKPYTGMPQGLDIQLTEGGDEAIITDYQGVNGTQFSSANPPTEIGEYLVSATLPPNNSLGVADGFVEIGTYKITKRKLILEAADMQMVRDTQIPSFSMPMAGGDGLLDGHSLDGVRVYTQTDGKTVGSFPIKMDISGLQLPLDIYDIELKEGKLKVVMPNPSGGNTSSDTGNNTENPRNSGNRIDAGSSGRRSGGGGSGSGSGSGRIVAGNKNSGNLMSGSWQKDHKGWWYKNADGSYPKSTWRELPWNGKQDWYYFGDDGYMMSGILKLTWLNKEDTYYLNASGQMQIGWQNIDGKWYYFYENTDASHVKGSMAISTKIGAYEVDAKGMRKN